MRGYCRSVKKAMQQHHLLVAPLRYGAGVKGKVSCVLPFQSVGRVTCCVLLSEDCGHDLGLTFL